MIVLNNIYKTFGKRDAKVEALRGISINIHEGEMVAIMGKSGSGKSTLLNIIGGIMPFDEGEYIFNGKKIEFNSQKELTKFRRQEIGIVVQYFALVDELNVYNNVALPLKYQGLTPKKVKIITKNILGELGIEDKYKKYPYELSGGQQQRVAIARALVKNPRIILADEPTGALDEKTTEEVLDLFEKMNKQGKTIVIVTHDEKVAQRCGRIINIKDGKEI